MSIGRNKRILSLLIAGIGVIGFSFAIRAWILLKRPAPPQERAPRLMKEPDELTLRTISLPKERLGHLLDGNFRIVRETKEIPSSCTMVFESSFEDASGSHAKPGQVMLANPGEGFQSGDEIVPGLPFRRLEFAGLGPNKCFVHYQQGGQPSSFCLAIIDYASQKAIWVAEAHKGARNVDELRRMILQQEFNDDIRWPAHAGC